MSTDTVKVPSDWTVAPLKRFLRVQSGEMISAEHEIAEGVPIIGGNGVRGYTAISNTKAPALVIGRVGAKCGCVHLIETNFWASEHAFVVYPQRSFDLRFGRYLLDYIDLNRFAIRTAQPLLNTEIVEGALSYWPPVSTQKEIADYLDHETTRLDTLIAEKQNLLELLAEKRRILITSAVTLGIKSKVKLKDSGIEWLKQIPSHWGTRRVAYLFSERDERGQPDLPLLVVSINTGVTLRKFSNDRIENMAADASSYKVARKGDISFNKMRMWQGAVGVSPTDGLVSPDYVVAEPIAPMDVEYFGLLFKTQIFNAETARRSHGITWDRLRLYWGDFRDIRVPLPPVAEQTAIVEAVKEQTAKLDALKGATERTITLLRERRTALIAAAVTGNIEIGE